MRLPLSFPALIPSFFPLFCFPALPAFFIVLPALPFRFPPFFCNLPTSLLSPPLPSLAFLFLILPFSFSPLSCFYLSPSSSRPPRLNAPKSLRANKFSVGPGMSPRQNKTQFRQEPSNFHSGPARSCKSGPLDKRREEQKNFFLETTEK